eukprot:13427063-Alexandrium_andersonii.AAC.1
MRCGGSAAKCTRMQACSTSGRESRCNHDYRSLMHTGVQHHSNATRRFRVSDSPDYSTCDAKKEIKEPFLITVAHARTTFVVCSPRVAGPGGLGSHDASLSALTPPGGAHAGLRASS